MSEAPAVDLATISDEALFAELGRRRSALRVTKTGGKNGGRPRCACGTCPACQRQANVARAEAMDARAVNPDR